jgi:hypothetical protein
MPRRLRISASGVTATAEVNDSRTADAIWRALPIEARASTWGDEIYFSIPVSVDEDHPKSVVDLGDIAYWPPGKAFCVFFGPTPASQGGEIKPASPVNVVGKVEGDPRAFRRVVSGARIVLERVEEPSSGAK